MGNYTRDEVLQMAEDEDVEFIRLQFTDMFGTLKNIAITARELPLHVRLVIINLDHRVEISQPRQVLLERGFPVNIFFSDSQKIKIGTV